MLTEDQIEAAVPREKGYKLADSGGLHVYITPAGSKSFRLKYRMAGVEKRLTFGLFPSVSLAEARRLRDEAKWSIKAQADPAQQRPSLDPGTVAQLEGLNHSGRVSRVYFVRGEAGLIKIGVTGDLPARLQALQRTHPVRLTLLGSMRGSHATEMTLHRLFADDRAHGEWFRPSQRLLDFIEENTSMRSLVCR